jgi:hypothetical protein
MADRQDKKKSFFVETEEEKKQLNSFSDEEVEEFYEPNPQTNSKQIKKSVLKKYKVILATPTYIVISDNGNGIRIDNNTQNKKIGDEIEIEL